MLCLTMLASGSAGNCAVVRTDECVLLVDCGLSARQIVQRLALAGLEPSQLDGILITHEHGDHVAGLEVFSKKFNLPIYCNVQTAESVRHGALTNHARWQFFQTGADFVVKDITVRTFPVPHDAADPVGFVFRHGQTALGFATDLGFATKLVLERMRGVQTLVIETNHDENLLQQDSRRPWAVKQRIMSRHGHLSNGAAADVLGHLFDGPLERVILGHLSRDCNRPELALETVRARLAEAGDRELELWCASQTEVSEEFALA
jgi:phosphoribosyl 1,2-cyclic phosphodiesterase